MKAFCVFFKGSSGFRDGKTSEQDERMGLDLPSLTWAIVRMGAETHVPSALQEVKSLVGMGVGGSNGRAKEDTCYF